jgi:hypothetical protein
LESVTPYSQSRYYKAEKQSKELAGDYETRTWRERCHSDKDGNIIIPPMAFMNSLKEAAKYLGLPIPGKARQTFTKHFEAGVLVQDYITLPIKKADVEGEWLFVPSDGKRGGGSRVEKCFPLIHEWKGTVIYYIMDDIITQDAFKQVLEVSGNLIGIGRFRPRNCGYYGRFKCNGITWVDK